MSSEIEDTLLATDEGEKSESRVDADSETMLAATQLGSDEADPDSSGGDEALAQTQASGAESGPALAKTKIGRPSSSIWVPLSLQKADLPTVAKTSYEVNRELARGGMGRILSAHDNRLGRPVAIKELLRGSAAARARFVREACITARLQHPAIVPLYEAGHWPDGEPFFAMKLVAGEPLDEVARRCQDKSERLALLGRVLDVADALAYAHSKEVIHRDLKPANVLVGDFGETVVIDWGLAKHLDRDEEADLFDREAALMNDSAKTLDGEDSKKEPAEGESNALTVMGQAMGTPSYMAPEQARGEKVDKRADVYSLGAILYQVLSGKVAYSGSKSAAEVLGKVLQGPPKALEEITEGLPAPLLTIVSKAMARDREDRYLDASEFAEELRSYQAGNLVSAHQYSISALLWRWIRSHRTLVVSGSLVVLVGIVAFVVSYRSIAIERDKAMTQMKRAEAQTDLAELRSLELALNIASDLAEERPLEAIMDLNEMKNLGQFPDTLMRARMIASQARSHRIPTELTARGSDHGVVSLAPDDRTVAIAWHGKELALLDLESRTTKFLEADFAGERINLLSYSPDGKTLVVGTDGSKGALWAWNLEEPTAPIVISEKRARHLRFSPDGRWLTAGTGTRFGLFDMSNLSAARESERDLRGLHSGTPTFSPDSKTLAFIAQDLFLYDIESGEQKLVLEGSPSPHFPGRREIESDLIFSPDGTKLILAGSKTKSLNLATLELESLFALSGSVGALAFSSDSKTLAVGSTDRVIYLYDFTPKGGHLNALPGHPKEVRWLEFTDGDRGLVSAGRGGELRLWHIGVGLGRPYFLDQVPEILTDSLGDRIWETRRPILFHDQSKVMAFDRVGVLRVWSRLRPDVHRLGEPTLTLGSIFSIGAERMVWSTSSQDRRVHLAGPDGETRVLGELGDQIEALAISSDDRYVAAGGTTLKLWDTKSGESKALEGLEGYMRFLAFSGDRLISANHEGRVFAWDLASGKGELVAEHGNLLNGKVGVTLDPKGRWVATAGIDKQVFLHNLRDGSKRLLATTERAVRGMAASPQGDLLAMGLVDSEVAVYSTLAEADPVVLHAPDEMEQLMYPDFSPDGKALVVSSGALGLRLWRDWRASEESQLLRGRDQLYFPRFSEEGEFIVAAGSTDGLASLWHTATGQRRDLRGRMANGKAEFWPGHDRVVISDRSGVISIWHDDLPKDWPGLESWIRGTVLEKGILIRPQKDSAPAPADLR